MDELARKILAALKGIDPTAEPIEEEGSGAVFALEHDGETYFVTVEPT